MSRISKGCLPAGRNAAASTPPLAVLRRGRAFAGAPAGDGDETLDLFTRTRRGYQISSSGESVGPNRMEKKASIGSARAGRSGADEFFFMEIGKHDYDWLLTPPGTPPFSSVDSTDHQPPQTAQRSNSNLRPAIVKTSRLSGLQPDNSYHSQRPARSSSTTRASFSTNNRTPSSVLNTSSASVNSRPTTPSNRARTPVAGPRPAASRPSSPARTRPNTATVEKPKPPALTSRPSTPNPRPHFPASSGPKPIPARLNTQPSTPTRRSQPPAVTPRRPSSPVPRSTAPVQPIIPPDFPLEAPPNLRTKLPERAVSAGRQRPGMALTVRANSNVEAAGIHAVSCTKRTSSPAVARGRIAENQAKGRMNGNRDKPTVTEKKPVKPVLAPEVGGYGRTMSKNSLNMALKHMDIRQGTSFMRGGGGASLFPHSIRSASATAAVRSRPEPAASTHKNRSITENGSDSNEITSKGCLEDCSEGRDEEAMFSEVGRTSVKTVDMNLYGSPRYDAMLLKEDARSLNWIHSLDERSDESYPFDHRFEPLPEPFFLMQQSVNL